MKILVCTKAVNEKQVGTHYNESRMSLFDEFALEQALLFRDELEKTTVDVLGVGMDNTPAVLTRALGMGADQAIHIYSEAAPLQDPFYTASLIAAHAGKMAYDLILTGVMSEDLMQGQVGPMLAELLLMPCATSVISAHLAREGIALERELEGGARESWEFPLPCVLTVQSGINTPRYPSLSGMMRAARNPLTCIQAQSLNPPVMRQVITRISVPEKKRKAMVLGEPPRKRL